MSIVKSTEDKLKLKILNTSHNYAQAFSIMVENDLDGIIHFQWAFKIIHCPTTFNSYPTDLTWSILITSHIL
jgi:hypothetical protein